MDKKIDKMDFTVNNLYYKPKKAKKLQAKNKKQLKTKTKRCQFRKIWAKLIHFLC